MKSCFQFIVILVTLGFVASAGEFRCDYRYSPTTNAWFKHFVVPATWLDARLRCLLEGGVLASPITRRIEAEMKSTIKKRIFDREIFTGIHATISQGDYHTVQGIPLSGLLVNWQKNEPNNLNNSESCLSMNSKGELADRNCDEPHPYICYRHGRPKESPNACGTYDPGYQLDSRTNSCYKFHFVPRSFVRANFACAAEGGHLVIINSDIEARVVKELFVKNERSLFGPFWKEVVYVGFYDWGEHGDWTTVNGVPLGESGYNKWASKEPSNSTAGEFCGSINNSGLYNDIWCTREYAFICEKNPSYPPVCDPEDTVQDEEG